MSRNPKFVFIYALKKRIINLSNQPLMTPINLPYYEIIRYYVFDDKFEDIKSQMKSLYMEDQ